MSEELGRSGRHGHEHGHDRTMEMIDRILINQQRDHHILNSINQALHNQGKQLMALADDLANLVAVVTSLVADVSQVLTQISNAPNITPDQVAALEAQIAALQTLDTNVKAAITPVVPTP